MLPAFCIRLCLGLVAFLPLLPARSMHPRFFRTQFLTALASSITALLLGYEFGQPVVALLIASAAVSLLGSLSWTLEPPPLGRFVGWLATAIFGAGAALMADRQPSWQWAEAITSGLLFGGTVTAMLVGHSYLISPGLTIRPLLLMLAACGLSLLARTVVLGVATWNQLADAASIPADYWLFFAPRCLIGLGGPLLFGVLAWRTAKIQSTQSATGILYVVVICTFIGELMGMLIARATGASA